MLKMSGEEIPDLMRELNEEVNALKSKILVSRSDQVTCVETRKTGVEADISPLSLNNRSIQYAVMRMNYWIAPRKRRKPRTRSPAIVLMGNLASTFRNSS